MPGRATLGARFVIGSLKLRPNGCRLRFYCRGTPTDHTYDINCASELPTLNPPPASVRIQSSVGICEGSTVLLFLQGREVALINVQQLS